jgi:hypothetical protein
MFTTLLLLSIGFIGFAFIGFAITILFKKNGEFPETSISKNKGLRKRKIYCIKTEQKIIDKNFKEYDRNGSSCCSSF